MPRKALPDKKSIGTHFLGLAHIHFGYGNMNIGSVRNVVDSARVLYV